MSGKFFFSAAEDEKLVEAVAPHSCLYDNTNKDYKSLQIREDAWREIGAAVERNVDDCKKRWRNIKDTYMKYRKTKYHKGSTNKPKTKWPLYQQLSFLNSVSLVPRNRSKKPLYNKEYTQKEEVVIVEVEVDESDRKEIKTQKVDNTKSHTETAKKKQQIDDQTHHTFQLRPYERNTMCDNCDNDPVLLFFKSMAMTVKTFEPHLIVEAKARICQIVNEIELKSIQVREGGDCLFTGASSGESTATG